MEQEGYFNKYIRDIPWAMKIKLQKQFLYEQPDKMIDLRLSLMFILVKGS